MRNTGHAAREDLTSFGPFDLAGELAGQQRELVWAAMLPLSRELPNQ